MSITFNPLSDRDFGVEVLDVDLARPLSAETFDELRALWLKYAIVVFRRQTMSPAEQIAFSKRLGELEEHTLNQFTMPDYPEIFVISNVVEGGRPVGAPKAGRHWHSDSHYTPKPSMGSLMLAREVPAEKGDTLFCDLRAAYDALPDATKARIRDLKVLVSRQKAYPVSYPERPPLTPEQRAKLPDVVHPLCRTHPETGRPLLYIGGNVVWEVVDMPLEEGRALIQELRDFATQERFVYGHHWEVGDAVLWDNRCTLHCATPFDESRYRRLMHRTTLKGDMPYFRVS
jgi:taurine dioxygenase